MADNAPLSGHRSTVSRHRSTGADITRRVLWAMKTKEFIRIHIDAAPQAVHGWLESVAAVAQEIGNRAFCVASVDIDPAMPVEPLKHHRRYGVFTEAGALVVTADLHCPDAGTTVLALRRDEAFPLVAEELMLRLEERFPGAQGEILAERPRTRAGAPPLACNVWLEEQLRLLRDPAQYHHLYTAWLAHYVTLRGYEPLDPRRSFRAAARGCLKRMRACRRA
jgi:hypothetical protein